MAEFYFDNLAKNLPDAYNKSTISNNFKILELERTANNDLRSILVEIENSLDIENATGATLDLYGKEFGQARGKANDEQFRVMIKAKIIRSFSNGSYKSVIDAICSTFGCSIDDVYLAETDNPMAVSLEKAPLEEIIRAGFTTNQAYQIIKSLLPVGVDLESVLFEGTFEFAETDTEYDETAGFAESDDDQEIGGYLGAAEGDINEAELPI